ncbi:hypothetical protein EV44_g0249 [Erysiphe necator]|uniref:Uncharacterized protein n=1 Tax=Uncinula necator TaxID=52586 RepID=A0A0B1NZY1_UNCNE|nr:hypothetical protein EV44_g0249 [Erysiphe necator]
MSRRLIVSIAPSLFGRANLCLRDLSENNPLIYNGCKLTFDGQEMKLTQKGQADRLQLVGNSDNPKKAYQEQRARGAYLATICQPEAALLLSMAAQYQNRGKGEINALDNQLKWQIDHKNDGLIFKPFNLESAKLYVFVDGAFATNQDFSSQIGFVIVLGKESARENEFSLEGNIIHWSSITCRRITRSVLASELYAMAHGVDTGIILSTTLEMITQQVGIPKPPTILCTHSFSLDEWLVKLGISKEKRFMIDMMSIRPSYEKRTRTAKMLEFERQAGERMREVEIMNKERNRMVEELIKIQQEQDHIAQEHQIALYYQTEALKHAEEVRINREEERRRKLEP